MPQLIQPQVSYPGVYVVELPAATQGIQGVPTSITAFVGRTAMGPENEAIPIQSFGDFERLFGPLSEDYTLPWAVRDFFANGGAQGLVVRLTSNPPAPVPTGFEAGGAAIALNVLDAAVKAGTATGSAIVPTLVLPSAVTDASAIAAAKVVHDAFNTAITQAKLTGAKGAALAPAVEATALAYVALLTDWTPPASVTAIGPAPLAGLANDAATLAAIFTAAPTKEPTVSAEFIDSLQTAWLSVRGPFTAVGALYGGLDLGTNASLLPTLDGGASILGAVWSLNGNLLASPGPADLLTAASTAYDALGGPQRQSLKPMLAAIRTAANAKQATAASVATASVTAWLGLSTGLSDAQLLFTGLSGCTDLATMIALGDALAGGIDGGVGTQTAPADDKTGKGKGTQKAAAATPAKDALDAAFGTGPATPQDLLDALLVGAGTTAVLTLAANGSGAWANGGALTVAVGAPSASPQLVASLGLKDSKTLFDLTVTYQAPGSPLATTNVYPSVTLAKGTPRTLDTVLLDDPYVRVQAVKDRTKTPAPCGPVSFAEGTDSPPLGQLDYQGDSDARTGLYALLDADIFNLLCLPWDVRGIDTPVPVYQNALSFCAANKAILLLDPPQGWAGALQSGTLVDQVNNYVAQIGGGITARNAGIWFPRILSVDPLTNLTQAYPPCGAVAGVIAATDASRGVWKAPAGTNAGLQQIAGLEALLTDGQNGLINPLGVNALRTFTGYGPVAWGDRTLRGATAIDDEYMYLSVRRLALYIEASLQRGLKWAVFEPNDDSLWSSMRASVTSFMAALKTQGAFYSFTVTCDASTTSQADIDAGIVNLLVQFAPVKPAEFVVLYFQQVAGQTAS